MMRAASAALALSLAACAPAAVEPVRAPAAQVDLRMPQTGAPARQLLERLAADCWLNGVVGGGSMIVDRTTGRVVVTSETQDLLIAQPVTDLDGTRVRLTGPAAADPDTARRLAETLESAVTTGLTTCPAASA